MNRILGLAFGVTGVVFPFAGSTAPSGWLLCDGSAVSRTTYANLFGVIGTAYGAGDGSTTFNLPDLRGRVAAGKDNMGGTAANRLTTGGSGVNGATLGAAGGAETHTLTQAQLAAHAHTASTNTVAAHTHTGSTASAGAHTHDVKLRGDLTVTGSGAQALNSPDAGSTGTLSSAGMASNGAHTHTVTVDAGGSHAHTVTVDNAGSGSAHNNTQPTIVLNHIIKT